MNLSKIAKYSAQTALGAATLYIGSQVVIPFISIPFTLQTLSLLLNCATLSHEGAVAASLTYVISGYAGLRVFANGLTGDNALNSPDGGYIFGFIASPLIHWCASVSLQGSFAKRCACLALADLSVLILGAVGLLHHTSAAAAFEEGALVFIPLEISKIMIASLIGEAQQRYLRINLREGNPQTQYLPLVPNPPAIAQIA